MKSIHIDRTRRLRDDPQRGGDVAGRGAPGRGGHHEALALVVEARQPRVRAGVPRRMPRRRQPDRQLQAQRARRGADRRPLH